MKQAQLHDGTVLEFPDETPDEVVKAAVKRQLSGQAQPTRDLGGDLPLTPEEQQQLSPEQRRQYEGRPLEQQQQPTRSFGEQVIGGLEAGRTLISGGTLGLVGGVTEGIAQTGREVMSGEFGSNEAADRIQQSFQQGMETGTIQPKTEAGKEQLQKFGEVAEKTGLDTLPPILPQTALNVTPFLSTGKMAKITSGKANASKTQAEKMQSSLNRQTDEASAQAGYEEAVKSLERAKPEELASLIDADPSLINAIDDLQLDTPPLASYYSKNPQYRAIEQGLASVDASDLNIQQKNFIKDLSQKADDIILEYGGDIDREVLSTSIKTDMLNTSKKFYEMEDMIYEGMRQKLPADTRVNPQNTIALIEKMASDLGGIDKLDGSIKTLYRKLKVKEKTSKGAFNYAAGGREQVVTQEMPTFALLEDNRKLIGRQIGKRGDTEFKNAETGRLKSLYAALKQDQSDIVKNQGDQSLLNLQNIADRMTIQRKTLEDNMVELYGKDLDKNMVNFVGNVTGGLAKQEVDKFVNAIEMIPEARRGEVVLSAMNQAWKGTAASKQQLGEAQFAKFWIGLNRSKRAKEELFKYLPEESRQAIENLGNVTVAVYKARQDQISTGRIDKFFEDQGGMVNRIFENLIGTRMGKRAEAVGSVVTKPIVGKEVKEFIMSGSDRAKAANQLLADQRMIRLIREAAVNDVNMGKPMTQQMKNIEKELKKSKRYAAWTKTLDEAELRKVESVGLVNYLLTATKEQQEEKK